MKATEARLLDFLRKSPQFVIPIYQRPYSWTERECRQLWDDIMRIGRDDRVPAHFIGSIVYVQDGIYQTSNPSPLLVIDGQQRLTTVMLVLEALARAVGDSEPVDGFSANKLRSYYLLNTPESGERRYKLILSQTDKDSLIALLDQAPKPKEYSIRIEGNFRLVSDWIAAVKDDLPTLCKGLAKLMIVDISLDRNQDNPQLIFESLNSTGRELSQADLIRNFVLMGLEPDTQTRLYQHYWRPMEVDFGQEAYTAHFDSFMRHYLTAKIGKIPNVKEVYAAFKEYARTPKAGSIEELVADIRRFAGYYCNMALGAEPDRDLAAAFRDIRDLRVDVAYPLLLVLYHDYVSGLLSKSDFLEASRLIESYVFRRSVCGIPTNSLDKTFATFAQALKKDRYLESIKAHFLLLPSYRRFPSDDEFKRDIQTRDLYNFRSRGYWLRRLENYGRKEYVPVDQYTIEHIMPQNENLSPEWQADLGPDWKSIQQKYLHTLGNLTLTGYNSEYSDHPFAKKRDMEGGFAQSPLRLNQGLHAVTTWNEREICRRAERLADEAVKVWPYPQLDPETIDNYRPRGTVYTIDSYPSLTAGPLRELFQALRKQLLALDPSVIEECLKTYIAYKAETNFADVIPQAKQLRILLNIPFAELKDPRGICRDVTGIGHHGNGDAEVVLASHDDLPYVVGLARQALDRQMGSGGEA